MAGLASGFQAGYRMADTLAREQEDKRRYGLQQERLERQEERQARADERQEQLYGLQKEALEHKKERRPVIEKQQDEQFKTQQETADLQHQTAQLALKEERKKLKEAEVKDAFGLAYTEFQNTGTISSDNYWKMYNAGQGTAFDISKSTDPQYVKDLDFLNSVTRGSGLSGIDQDRAMSAFNNVFKNDINKFNVADGAAYNRVTDVDIDKKGNFTFKVTAYDNDGNPIKSAFTGDAVPYKKLVDGVFSRKAVTASMMAHPEFVAQFQYAHKKYGGAPSPVQASNISFARKQYSKIVEDGEKSKRGVKKSFMDMGIMSDADRKKMQAELDRIDEETQGKLAALGSMYSKEELTQARIPIGGLSAGGAGGETQTTQTEKPKDDKGKATDELNAWLAKKGLSAI